MTVDPLNASDPRNANHHWFPFLRYQEQCAAEGRDATINGWLRSKGQLSHQDAYEAAKAKAAAEEGKPSAKPDTTE